MFFNFLGFKGLLGFTFFFIFNVIKMYKEGWTQLYWLPDRVAYWLLPGRNPTSCLIALYNPYLLNLTKLRSAILPVTSFSINCRPITVHYSLAAKIQHSKPRNIIYIRLDDK